ncbi:MAG TPA: Nif11-like leader peptide family natural product precursor [Blastocatellia bacterium]|nr:Nif11-like leader peptide family natural product precursor [Blastocatellia bacterium]
MSEQLENFRKLVLEDVALQEILRNERDYNAFVELTVQSGNQRGYSFTAEDVAAAYRESRRKWFERRLDQ